MSDPSRPDLLSVGPAALDVQLRAAAAVARRAIADSSARDPQALTAILYESWYCAVELEPGSAGVGGGVDGSPDLVAAYRVADDAGTRFVAGWQVASRPRVAPPGPPAPWSILVESEGRQRWVDMFDLVSEPIGCRPEPGQPVLVRLRTDDTTSQPGWWLRSSPNWSPTPSDPILRLYLNAPWERGATVVQALTRAVDRLDQPIRWTIKAPTEPAGYRRSDPVVAYVDERQWPLVAFPLTQACRQVAGLLRPTSPPLTRVVASGVSLAHNPFGQESFGWSRCRLVADAVLRAATSGGRPDEGVLVDEIRRAFGRAGLDPDRPWLRAATSPEPDWPTPAPSGGE